MSEITGWGRLIILNKCQVGWWKGGSLHGYCRVYQNLELKEEGWFENGLLRDDSEFKHKVYPKWEMKEEHFRKAMRYETSSCGQETYKRSEESD